jgi:DnaJ homolog subfamily C member 8
LPPDTFEDDYIVNVKEMFKIIEEKKIYMAKLEASKKVAKLEDLENKRMLDQYRIYTEEEWESTRE